MEMKRTFLNNKFWLVALAAFTVVFMIFSNRLGNAGIGDQTLFLLSQIAYVAIPGMALILLINPPADRLILALSAYMAGYALNIALFFLFCAMGLAGQLTLCMTIVSILSVLYIAKKRRLLEKMTTDHSGAWIVTILLAVFLTGVLTQTVANYNTPDFTRNTAVFIYQDLAWNMGNTTSIANGLPITDIHVEGLSLGYHYFVNVFAAMYKNILGATSYLIFIKFIPVVQVFIFIGGFYLLFSTLCRNKWLLLFAIGIAIMSSLMILVHLFWFSYVTAFGMGLSLAAAYYLVLYIRKIDTVKFYDRDFLMFLIFLAAVTGSKIMYAAPCLAGFTILAVIQIIRRRNAKNVFLSLAFMIAVFGAVYSFTSLGIHGYNSFEFGFAQLVWANPIYTGLLAQYPGIPAALLQLFVLGLHTLRYFLPFAAASIILIVWLIRSKGKEYPLKIFLLAAAGICYAAASVLVQNGLSQMMFLNAAMPLCAYAVFYAGRSIRKSDAKKCAKILYILLIACISVFCATDSYQSLTAQAKEAKGLKNDVSCVSENNVLYKDEYEGMVWLRDNTDKNAVFAADRFYNADTSDILNARYYNYTAFSERQCYLEGYEYIYTYDENFLSVVNGRIAVLNGVYSNDPDSLRRLIGEGVNYLVCSRRIHPDFVLDRSFGTSVFENEGMTIYRLSL